MRLERMLKKADFSPSRPARIEMRAFPRLGRREREPRGVLAKYVEGNERLRTKLGAFFSIRLNGGAP